VEHQDLQQAIRPSSFVPSAIAPDGPSLTGWTLFLRVSASLNPIIDFFNAGSNSGLLRLEHRFTDDLRKSAPWIDYPMPPRRRAFLHVKFCLAIPQESSSSFRSINTQRAFTNHHAPIPFPKCWRKPTG
jgi:hypothetical protein